MKNSVIPYLVVIAVAWIATSAAVVAGLFITKSAWCLWAFLLPASINFSSETHEDKEEIDKTEERL